MTSTYKQFDTLPPFIHYHAKDGETPPEDLKWSGPTAMPPAVGATVTVRMNGLGKGKVASYFCEHGWLGVRVVLAKPPKWYVEQNGRNHAAHAYGAELSQA